MHYRVNGGSLDQSLVMVTSEVEVSAPDDVATAQSAEPVLGANYSHYVNNSVACGEIPLSAVVAPLPEPGAIIAPEPGPAPDSPPAPVILPRHVVTPAQPMPTIKRPPPHSVAVIVARGADF